MNNISTIMCNKLTLFLSSLVIVSLFISSLLIANNVLTISLVKETLNATTMDTYQHRLVLLSNIKTGAQLLFPTTSSLFWISKALSSSITGNIVLFSTIENEVSNELFYVLKSHRQLSQISYIGKNGFMYAYYSKGGQIYAIYSNDSSQSFGKGSISKHWYTHQVNEKGLKHGETNFLPSINLVDRMRFDEILKSDHGHASLGVAWTNDQDPMLFYFSPFVHSSTQEPTGVWSFGFSFDGILHFMEQLALQNAYYYIFADNGSVIAQSPLPHSNTTMIKDGVFTTLTANSDTKHSIRILCKLQDHVNINNIMTVGDLKYQVYHSCFNILDIPSVLVTLFTQTGRQELFNRHNTVFIALTVSSIFSLVVLTAIFLLLIYQIRRVDVHFRAVLIKEKEATCQAERKSMNKSNAFASAAHDIRASLAPMIALIELCSSKVHSKSSDLKENFTQMTTYAQNLLGILNTVLDTSKIEAGKVQLEEEEFDLTKLLLEIVDMFYVDGMRKGLEVIWDPCDGSVFKQPFVRGDCKRIKQILINLLSNAVKFTTQGHVLVRVCSKKPQLMQYDRLLSSRHGKCFGWNISRIPFVGNIVKGSMSRLKSIKEDPHSIEIIVEVDDTGIGIPMEKRNSVFESFVQVHEAKNDAHEGTGLGLGIAQSLVRLMGGEIEIINKENEEHGTCFRFNIFLTTQSVGEEMAKPFEHGFDLNGASCFACGVTKSPKQDAIHAILWVHGDEQRRILQKWMEDKGIKVWVIWQLSELNLILERLRKSTLFQFSTSKKSDSARIDESSSSPSASKLSTEEQDCAKITRNQSCNSSSSFIARILRSFSSSKSPPGYILLLLDTTCVPLVETGKALENFGESIDKSRFKIVWLVDQINNDGFSYNDLSRLAPYCLIVPKPLHGTRFYSVSKILNEFGGIPHSGSYRGYYSDYTMGHSDQFFDVVDVEAQEIVVGSHEIVEHNEIKGEHESNVGPLRGLKVLVVDDDQVMCKYHARILEKYGAIVEIANNGEHAINVLERIQEKEGGLRCDVILMDCQMQVMDGIQATEEIRKRKDYFGHIPIIVVTGYSLDDPEMQRCYEVGADAGIVKPIKLENLTQQILAIVAPRQR